jgi:hypothetical protein
MIDWYDLNQCHRPQREAHDYTTGRIFRLGKKGQKVVPVAMEKMDSIALAKSLLSPDEWISRHALRRMSEKKATEEVRIALMQEIRILVPNGNDSPTNLTAEGRQTMIRLIRASS